MKLVTGIEAIQSGKPFRYENRTDFWITNDASLREICGNDLLIKQFIIKEEPREFWIFIDSVGEMAAYPGNYKGADTSGDNWIRVREVEK